MWTWAGLKCSFPTTSKGLEMAMHELNQLKAAAAIMCENVNTPAFNHMQHFGQIRYFKLSAHLCSQ